MNKDRRQPTVALMGNPNSGKSSLFNHLTGLRQDVSNFPGVTVDKKLGLLTMPNGQEVQLIDFPGTYSVFPNSTEEKIVLQTLTNTNDENYPDLVVYVADITQLDRHLLFATQIKDLGLPMIMVLNMIDLAESEGYIVHSEVLSKFLQCPVICASIRSRQNTELITETIMTHLDIEKSIDFQPLYTLTDQESFVASRISKKFNIDNNYKAKLIAHHFEWLNHLDQNDKKYIAQLIEQSGFNNIRQQVQETMRRFEIHAPIVQQTLTKIKSTKLTITDKIDRWITHRIYGPIIFFIIMLLVFQSIYSWAKWPMEWIEEGFALAGKVFSDNLGDHWWTDLFVNGLLAGLGGVLVFVPQIAILFFLIALLEESGYMSRVVFMFDSIMQKFGMNGRSMVSLISSGACAIPAIMSTRTISNPKERLITILVSPLISCSARLPVYAVLIGFVVPDIKILGIFNYQGLAFMGLYLLGIVGVIFSSLFFKKVLRSDASSFLMIELPNYKPPMWKNVLLSVKEKVLAFIVGAGRIILLISVLLWFLASFGPSDNMADAIIKATTESKNLQLDDKERDQLTASYKLESSYIGIMGKWIEPAIKPLGFDWKIGIALLTSFAAREVFVGTMATIYSVGSDSDEKTIRQKMAAELKPGTQIKVYNPATALSLLVFYVFAMQCMSTLAITKKETNTWKWPIIQFVFMSLLAYVGAWTVFQIMS
jgi:ferrous iron transport protein B